MIEATLNSQLATTPPRTTLVHALRATRHFPTIIEIPYAADPYQWLAAQVGECKLVWRNRDDRQATFGYGAAHRIQGHAGEAARDVLERCREFLSDLPEPMRTELKLFGGLRFHRAFLGESTIWDGFGQATFWLPRITLDGHVLRIVVLNERDRADALALVEHLQEPTPETTEPHDPVESHETTGDRLPAWTARHDRPGFESWQACIDQATDLFRAEVLEKIVLARQVDLTFPQPIDPVLLLQRLADATPSCYHFCFELQPGYGFVGATPERLFRRNGQMVESEVVAGTRPRGQTPADDQRLGDELLRSSKDQLEHDIVRKSIRQRLHPCVSRLEVDVRASLLKLATKQHLFSHVEGWLRSDVSDGDLLERLHPTPAVGGYPTENALSEIRRLEPFERGWYAAPVGWIGADSAEFAVGIRSGLVRHEQLSLFSGAGIVPGSTALAEWEEIEHKLSDFLRLFGPSTSEATARTSHK